jgi:hypothetical protein
MANCASIDLPLFSIGRQQSLPARILSGNEVSLRINVGSPQPSGISPQLPLLSMTLSSLSDQITYGRFTILVPPRPVWPTLRQSASIADHMELRKP